MITGVGFTVAPFVGGQISAISQTLPAIVSAILFGFNFLWVFFVLPESHTNKHSLGHPNLEPRKSNFNLLQFRALGHLLRTPITGSLLISHFFFTLGVLLFRSNFAIYAKELFDLSAQRQRKNHVIRVHLRLLTLPGLISVFWTSLLRLSLSVSFRGASQKLSSSLAAVSFLHSRFFLSLLRAASWFCLPS